MSNKLSIIIMSCDAYSDVWQPFADCWEKFWPGCPYPTFLVSETKSFEHPLIGNIKTDRKMAWGEMMLYVIEQIDTSHLIYMQEDYLLRSKVDDASIQALLEIFKKEDAAYLRLLPWPGPDEAHPKYDQLGILKPQSKYRTSLQAAVWDKQVLAAIVDHGDDGRFESWSIERAKEIAKPFLCLKRNGISDDINHDGDYPLNYFATAVFQGKWLKEAVRLYRSLGIDIDTSHRGVMNRIDFLEYHQRKKGTNSLRYRLLKLLKGLAN
ncbi:MAG: hypothetical protein AAGC88_05470 [Bacteroidota bacterium]